MNPKMNVYYVHVYTCKCTCSIHVSNTNHAYTCKHAGLHLVGNENIYLSENEPEMISDSLKLNFGGSSHPPP